MLVIIRLKEGTLKTQLIHNVERAYIVDGKLHIVGRYENHDFNMDALDIVEVQPS